MSKNHRGKGIKEKVKSGRGTCPLCKRTGVKVVYEREVDKVKVNICKICNVGLTKKAKQAQAPSAPQTEPAPAAQ
jgi:hypothetical protein